MELSNNPLIKSFYLDSKPSQDKNELLPTPLSPEGLVDQQALITILKTHCPDFPWAKVSPRDRHHVNFPRNLYARDPELLEFYNSASNSMIVPIHVHRFIHARTEPPPIPDKSIIREHNQANRVIRELFKNAWQATRLERGKWMSEERLLRGQGIHLERSQILLEQARDIPKEFQPFDFDTMNTATIEDVCVAAKYLGSLAVRPKSWSRYIQQAAI